MTLRLIYKAARGEFDEAMRDLYLPLATAGTKAVREAGDEVKSDGRSDIARAGFSKRWQNTFRVDVYPEGSKVSLNAAALIYHKIPYAEVFETGATIRGKPKMWVPLPHTPKKIRRRHTTPARFVKEIGPLVKIGRIGRDPLLAAPAALSKAQARKAKPKVSVRALRRGAQGGTDRTRTRNIPLFVGVSSIDVPKKLEIYRIINRAAGSLAERFIEKMRGV